MKKGVVGNNNNNNIKDNDNNKYYYDWNHKKKITIMTRIFKFDIIRRIYIFYTTCNTMRQHGSGNDNNIMNQNKNNNNNNNGYIRRRRYFFMILIVFVSFFFFHVIIDQLNDDQIFIIKDDQHRLLPLCRNNDTTTMISSDLNESIPNINYDSNNSNRTSKTYDNNLIRIESSEEQLNDDQKQQNNNTLIHRNNHRTVNDMVAIIHIGPHKTGTTTIQYEAHRLTKYLLMDSYELPQTFINDPKHQINDALSPNHFRLAHCLKNNNKLILNKTLSREYCDPHFLLSMLNIASHQSNIILSAERFSDPDTLLDQFQLLLLPWQQQQHHHQQQQQQLDGTSSSVRVVSGSNGSTGGNIRIIGYYRRFYAWLISWHNQIMKKKPISKRVTIIQWIKDTKKLQVLYNSIYVMGSIPRYQKTFGVDNVYVYNTHDDNFNLITNFFCTAIPNANHTCQLIQSEQQLKQEQQQNNDNENDDESRDDESVTTTGTTNSTTAKSNNNIMTTATTTTTTVKNSASKTLIYQEIALEMQRRASIIVRMRRYNNNNNNNVNRNRRNRIGITNNRNLIEELSSTSSTSTTVVNDSSSAIDNRLQSRSQKYHQLLQQRSSSSSQPLYNMSTLTKMIQNQHENIWNYTSSDYFDNKYKICPNHNELQLLYQMTIKAEEIFGKNNHSNNNNSYDEEKYQGLKIKFDIASNQINQLCTVNVTKLLDEHPLWYDYFYTIFRIPKPSPRPSS